MQRKECRFLVIMRKAQNKWEGRIITMDYPEFFLVNAYFPNPLRDKKRLGFRKKWDNAFYDYIEKLNSIKQTIVCGDFNLIARKEDSHSQVQSSLQEHVALMSRERSFFFHATDSAFVDAYRFRHPAKERCGYTWWSNRINYREEAEAQFVPFEGVTQRCYPYTGYEYDGVKYHDFVYAGLYEDDDMPMNDYEVWKHGGFS